MRPIGVDLFAGAGGLSLGFEQAGFDIVAAVDIDPIHAIVHAYNFPKTKVLARSVIGLSADEIREEAGIGSRKIDVVFGGAPCQGFSLIGQRQMDDPRNTLVREFVRLVADFSASYAVFENVKGLTVGRHREFLIELCDAFGARGYNVLLPWQVLNASKFGVPQVRERLFILAAKRGLRLPRYPQPPPGSPITCKKALGDLPNGDDFVELVQSDCVPVKSWYPRSAYAKELRCMTNDCWHYGYVREWNPNQLSSSLRTEHTEISRRRFAATVEGEIEPFSRFFKLPENGLSNTLRAGTDSARGAFTSPRPIHYRYPRCVTVREMMRLHGYPDWFRMHTTKWHGARQVGNSVPPPLARAVAAEVLKASGYKPTRPKETLRLGNEATLSYDMAACMRMLNIEKSPIGRRDRKSVHKKRKQEEIEALLRQETEADGNNINKILL